MQKFKPSSFLNVCSPTQAYFESKNTGFCGVTKRFCVDTVVEKQGFLPTALESESDTSLPIFYTPVVRSAKTWKEGSSILVRLNLILSLFVGSNTFGTIAFAFRLKSACELGSDED